MAMMKKHKLELYANLLVKQNLFADEHPPTKKPCPQHIFRIHTSLCILCLLPASVTIPAWLKSSSPVLPLLSTNTLFRISTFKDFRFKV